MIKTVNKYII